MLGSADPSDVASAEERPAIDHALGLVVWPAETNLVFLEESNKVMLTAQRPLVRAVVQDAIERTRAALMFSNAFPDLYETLEIVGDALIMAAEHNEAATDIRRRLLVDHMYKINLTRVVSPYT